VGSKFVNNAKIIAIEVEKILVEAHHSIGKIEKYHAPVKRVFEVIIADLGNTITPEHVLQMAVKAVNDTAGPNGLVSTLLVFGIFPRISHESPPSPSIAARGEAMRKAMAEVHKLKAQRQVADALAIRNGPNVENVLQLLLQNEVRIYREKHGWTGPYKLIALNDNGNACTVDVDGKITDFRIISVRPYHRDEHTVEPSSASDSSDGDSADENYRPNPKPELGKPPASVPRRRNRSSGSKNKPKNTISVTNVTKKDAK
jgi:hypothetical protein